MLMAAKIRLLIVDDSALMRKHLVSIFAEQGDFEIETARNGVEALKLQQVFKPDVITLDVNMPEMDGLTALSMLMAERPTSVIMVSSLTEKGAMTTFEALALGAVDFVPKPGGTISLSIDSVREHLLEKVRAAAKIRRAKPGRQRMANLAEPATTPAPPVRSMRAVTAEKPVLAHATPTTGQGTSSLPMHPFGLVCVGVSTGGPRVLEEILPQLPADFPWPVLIAQHMPATFTQAFANRLNGLCALEVMEVSKPVQVQPGCVYIGKGGTDMVVSNRLGKIHVLPKPENADYLWHPSVEAMMLSVAKHFNPSQVVGVMLTGMGYDGSDAMAALKHAGARTVAESEDSATVFGMPAELIRKGGASMVLPSSQIADQLKRWLGVGAQRWA